MGTIYTVSCKDCKVARDLDKFYGSAWCEDQTREKMLEYAKDTIGTHEGWLFRSALLVDFMHQHRGHDCVFFDEYMPECELYCPNYEYDPDNDNGFRYDTDFWKEAQRIENG